MKIVLAYFGGLDTSHILGWLRETYNAEIVCFCADIGQREELDGLEAKAMNAVGLQAFIALGESVVDFRVCDRRR
jgi:argininosuccinate synthase